MSTLSLEARCSNRGALILTSFFVNLFNLRNLRIKSSSL
jgi:hypothetical protein